MNRKNVRTIQDNFLINHFYEFCNATTIHGLRYVSEKNASWLQSLVWLSFVIFGGIFSSVLMLLVWDQFENDPTIVAVENVNYPVWNVPFPSVTICNPNNVYRPKIGEVKNILISNNVADDEIESFLRSLSTLVLFDKPMNNFTKILTILQSKYNPETLMLELMHPCAEMLKQCTWMGKTIDCGSLFNTIKTDEGFCCSFNYHHTNESFLHMNAFNNKSLIYVGGIGVHNGLSVILDVDDQNWVSTTRTVPSALVHIHNYLNYPEMKMFATLIEKGEMARLLIDPTVLDTTDDVKALSQSKRNCLFEDEAQLSIGAYGFENCITECRMNGIVDLCGCIPFIYNTKTYKHKLRFCDLSDGYCLKNNQQKLYTLHSSSSNSSLHCQCFTTCDMNWYPYTVDISPMSGQIADRDACEMIAIYAYFNAFSCLKYRQSNLVTWDGLFAAFGGIYGLCLGGSILSIAEFFYHFTIKLYSSYRSRKCIKIDFKRKKFKKRIATISHGDFNFKL